MFDNIQITKAYTLHDNINDSSVEVCTFNATLNKQSGVTQYMNINYPNLYNRNTEEILLAYRKFNAEVSAIAITMNLATEVESVSTLNELEDVKDLLLKHTTEVMNGVIKSLENIQVNPVPMMEVGANHRMMY